MNEAILIKNDLKILVALTTTLECLVKVADRSTPYEELDKSLQKAWQAVSIATNQLQTTTDLLPNE